MSEPSREGDAPILVLAHPGDRTAAAVAAWLRRRAGSDRVCIATPEELFLARRWSHALGEAGVRTRIELANGIILGDPPPGAVLDRLRFVRPPQFARGTAEDREYATMELHALLLSWLASLSCPIVNRPSPRGLGGAERGRLEWLRVAQAAGLPVRRTRATTNARDLGLPGWPWEPAAGRIRAVGAGQAVPTTGDGSRPAPPRGRRPATFAEPLGPERRRCLVVGETVLGAPSRDLEEPARCLAATAGCTLLGLTFGRPSAPPPGAGHPDRAWRVVGVDPQPELSDAAAIETIGALLLDGRSTARHSAVR